MSESTINIRPVRREAAKVIVGLAGTSGSGKTYSALQLAYGLANKDASKIGMLDTENKRGSLYADMFPQPFMIGDLYPPFSPMRYTEALRQFAESGVEVIVVDSMSHEWEGEGGCEELAHLREIKKNMPNWLLAKREHKKFMNALLLMPAHVIACFRAREKMDFRSMDKPVSLGLQPITEKNVLFEMTASFMIHESGREREIIKLPGDLAPILGEPLKSYLTPEHGLKLREWIGGVDPMERAKDSLRLAAASGSQSLRKAWETLSRVDKERLSSFKDTLKDTANHADAEHSGGLSEADKKELEAEMAGGRA